MSINEAPTVWSSAVPPGGYVCAVPVPDNPDGICGMPAESEDCTEHTACVNCTHPDDHENGCPARLNGEPCPCPGYLPAWKANTR